MQVATIRLPGVVLLALAAAMAPGRASAQLLEHLQAFGSRIAVGDPNVPSGWEGGSEGPKGIAAGDLNGDGFQDLAVANLDGTVSLLLARPGKLEPAGHLRTGAITLRDVLVADLTGDGKNDIAAAALVDGAVFLFTGRGDGRFDPPARIETWPGARDLATGDFDGDGQLELVVAGSGQGLRQYRRDAKGVFVPVATLVEFSAHEQPVGRPDGDLDLFTKPVYSLRVFRPSGSSRDELLVTHAESPDVCVVAAGPGEALVIKSCLPIAAGASGVFGLEITPITGPAAGGMADLITVHRDLGTIQVRHGSAGPERFDTTVTQDLPVPGGPRHIASADLDGDGWNDLVVVLRNFDRIVTYRNDHGKLVLSKEMPVGSSPRELVRGDFNRDGQIDFAVINRLSQDVSLLPGVPGEVGFGSLDQVYLGDGGQVIGFDVRDFNGDGRADIIQLYQGTGDVSVRLAKPDGSLASPVIYTLGSVPADLRVQDVNNDGFNDLVTVNFGRPGIEKGSVSVRLGQAGGTFGPEARYELPPLVDGSLFALVVADFSGDGRPDLAVGYTDCRISFFGGTGDGRFAAAGSHDHAFYAFGYEMRGMAVGDFDRDGDIDLAGAAMSGDHIIVAENEGNLLEATTLKLHRFNSAIGSTGFDGFPSMSMATVDLNHDGDLDLLVGTGAGTIAYLGGPGLLFTASRDPLPGTVKVPTSSLAIGDLDGDGDEEIVVSCKLLACVVVLTREGGDAYFPALIIDVPSGQFVAMGDIDGDGHLDLAGTGEVLWTALSSRRPQLSGPPVLEDPRERLRQVVINEFLAINNKLPLDQDAGKKSDWIELFNGAAGELSLAGHRLVLSTETDPAQEYRFSADAKIASGAHLLLLAEAGGAMPHLGFKLPGSGGNLKLLDAAGAEVDSVRYPAQEENVSFARYRDGLPSFVFNAQPSPARENSDNGAVDPAASLLAAVELGGGLDHATLPIRPGEPIRFFARGQDRVFLMNLSVMARRLDDPSLPTQRIILYDDGRNEDGATQDGLFSGVWPEGLPAGGAIEFFLEATNFAGTTIQVPDGAFFTSTPRPGQVYTMALGATLPRLELSEFVARNTQGLRDEAGQFADWVEIRNCSTEPISLAGFYLADRFPASDEWYALPTGRMLAPGEHLVVFCDGRESQGPLHAPFRVNADGGELFLIGTVASLGQQVIDAVKYPAQPPDTAWGRQVCGGEWSALAPTPGLENPSAPRAALGDVDRSGTLDITDPILILGALFLGGSIACPPAMDVNQDNANDISDVTYLLGYLFLAGPARTPADVACP